MTDPSVSLATSSRTILRVAGSGTNSLQTGYPGVQGSTWRCTTLPRSADPCRRPAWSTNTPSGSTNANRLVVPPVKLSTVSSRAFAVAAPHIWNTLPTDVVAASSLSTFRRLLKRSYSNNHILTVTSSTDTILLISNHNSFRKCFLIK